MVKKKNIRQRGKISLSRYFRKFNEGDSVAIKREISVGANFPKRLQGRTGVIKGKKGRTYIVKLKDQNLNKEYLIRAIHLNKISQIKSK